MNKHALLVGVAEYEDKRIRSLRYASQDTVQMGAALRFCCGFRAPEVLTGREARFGPVYDAVERIRARAREEDLFVFYFAGHGVEHDTWGHLLLLRGARIGAVGNLCNEALSVRDLKDMLMTLPCRRMAVILDASHGRLDSTRTLDAAPMGELAARDAAFLAQAEGGREIQVMCSCSPGEESLEAPSAGGGVFASAFIEAVERRSQRGARIALGRELLEEVRSSAQRALGELSLTCTQRPFLEGLEGEVVLLAERESAPRAEPAEERPAEPETTHPEEQEAPAAADEESAAAAEEPPAAERAGEGAAAKSDHVFGKVRSVFDPEAESRRYREEAERGDAEAQFRLGRCYERGEGVDRDKAEAARWYIEAAKQGHARAQFNAGCCCDNGDGVAQDKSQAVTWYRRAAEQGHAVAAFNLAISYSQGEGVEPDRAEAARWYRVAAEGGVASAQFNLGNSYYNGDGVDKDVAEAARWYRKAAEGGVARAQFNLGNSYYNGEGVERDHAEAARWYRKAAEQGLAAAQFVLGNSYYSGVGVEEDKAEALGWYLKAAEQGHVRAQYKLGSCYERGEGTPVNKEEAARWYRKAADAGHAGARYDLGYMEGRE